MGMESASRYKKKLKEAKEEKGNVIPDIKSKKACKGEEIEKERAAMDRHILDSQKRAKERVKQAERKKKSLNENLVLDKKSTDAERNLKQSKKCTDGEQQKQENLDHSKKGSKGLKGKNENLERLYVKERRN